MEQPANQGRACPLRCSGSVWQNLPPQFDSRLRKRLHPKKVKPRKLFKPTVQAVKEIVPNKLIPKSKPMTLLKPRNPLS